jgi:hypothetical protein
MVAPRCFETLRRGSLLLLRSTGNALPVPPATTVNVRVFEQVAADRDTRTPYGCTLFPFMVLHSTLNALDCANFLIFREPTG